MKQLYDISNIKGAAGVLALVMLLCGFAPAADAAGSTIKTDCGYVAASEQTGLNSEKLDDTGLTSAKKFAQNVIKEINSFCSSLQILDPKNSVSRSDGFMGVGAESYEEYKDRFNKTLDKNPAMKAKYEELAKVYDRANQSLLAERERVLIEHKAAVDQKLYTPCGDGYPKGCPEGKECLKKYTALSADAQTSNSSGLLTEYDCKSSSDLNLGWKKAPGGSVGSGDSIETNVAGGYTKLTTDETGKTSVETNMGGSTENPCIIAEMYKIYQAKCYSCIIVKTLIETFMSACSKAYDVTSEAGIKLLALGALIWMAFFVMKNVSSFSSVEPGSMVNTLAVFLFKVMVAYILITSGLGVLIKYTVNPLLTAGADFGMALMATTGNISGAVNPEYAVKMATVTAEGGKEATEIVSAEVINKIMLFTQNLDKTVSTNLVVGHAITCHAMNAGAWDLKVLKIVNLWIWLCGALIWFVGFMLTLGICYYLLDISFKLGFAIMAMPVVIGLWPFNITKGKITAVISIILKSGAIFAFLALTTTYTLILISTAMRDIPTLLQKVEAGETQWISDTFDITGPYFLIILFAYLYSMKLISATISDYVDKFFSDGVFGGSTPIHGMTTQMTDFAKQKAMQVANGVGGKVKDAAKERVGETLGKAGKFVKGLYKGKSNPGGGTGTGASPTGGGNGGGSNKPAKKTGAEGTAAQTGSAATKAGETAEAVGKTAEQGGKATAAGGQGLMNAGKALSGTGAGMIIGLPMMAVGGAMKIGGKTAEYAGKGTQQLGKVMKKGGKSMKKLAEKMENTGSKMEKAGQKLQYGDNEKPKPRENSDETSRRENK